MKKSQNLKGIQFTHPGLQGNNTAGRNEKENMWNAKHGILVSCAYRHTPSHVFIAFLLTPPFTLTHSCPESCVSAQLPSPARSKQETGVEVSVHSVINVSVSQREVGGGMVRKEGGRGRAADKKREERKEYRDIKLPELPLCRFFFKQPFLQ